MLIIANNKGFVVGECAETFIDLYDFFLRQIREILFNIEAAATRVNGSIICVQAENERAGFTAPIVAVEVLALFCFCTILLYCHRDSSKIGIDIGGHKVTLVVFLEQG